PDGRRGMAAATELGPASPWNVQVLLRPGNRGRRPSPPCGRRNFCRFGGLAGGRRVSFPRLHLWCADGRARVLVRRDSLSWRYALLWFLRDLLLPILWSASWLGNDFVWRGHPMRVPRAHGRATAHSGDRICRPRAAADAPRVMQRISLTFIWVRPPSLPELIRQANPLNECFFDGCPSQARA